MRRIEEDKGVLIEDYIELRKRFKAKSARVEREQTEMSTLFRDFVKKHEAAGRAVFMKDIGFYLDSINEFDYKTILAALDDEIKALKREMEDRTKIELEKIKNFQDFVSSPDDHFKEIKETSNKLLKAVEAEKKLLIDNR